MAVKYVIRMIRVVTTILGVAKYMEKIKNMGQHAKSTK